MSNYLVPSSPIGLSKNTHTLPTRFNGTVTGTTRQHVALTTVPSNKPQFPTPNPSSSIGDIPSSPIKDSHDDPNLQTPNYTTPTPTPAVLLKLQFAKSQSSSVVLGRSSKLSDIMLPPRHGISKRHLRITYLPENNKVKLECLGLNSIVVSIPFYGNDTTGHYYYIRQLDSHEPLYELLLPDEVGIGPDRLLHCVSLAAGSFSLKCGESCVMSLLEGMSVSIKSIVKIVITGLSPSGSDFEMGTKVTYLTSKGEKEEEEEEEGVNVVTTPRRSLNLSDCDSKFVFDSDSEQLVTTEFPRTPFVCEGHSNPRTPVKLRENYSFREESPLIRKPKLKKKKKEKSVGKTGHIPQFLKSRPMVSSPIFNTQREQPLSSSPSSPLSSSPCQYTKGRKRTYFEVTRGFYDLDLLPPVNIQSKRRRTSGKEQEEEDEDVENFKETLTDELLQAMTARGINCEEIQHVLSNYLAFASVQQVPFSHLKACSGIISSLSEDELRALLRAERSIGVIERHGKDAAGNPLEEEYYYDLENDEDRDRQRLVSSVKGGRVGLRACRKTHKQYFWKKPEHRVRKRE